MQKTEYNFKSGFLDIMIQIMLPLPIILFLLGEILGIESLKFFAAFWFLLMYLILYQLISMILGWARGRKFRRTFTILFTGNLLIIIALTVLNKHEDPHFLLAISLRCISVSYVFICIWEYWNEKKYLEIRQEDESLLDDNFATNNE